MLNSSLTTSNLSVGNRKTINPLWAKSKRANRCLYSLVFYFFYTDDFYLFSADRLVLSYIYPLCVPYSGAESPCVVDSSSTSSTTSSITSVRVKYSCAANFSLYRSLQYTPKTRPNNVHPNTIAHSCGYKAEPDVGTTYMTSINPDMSTAIIPTKR